MVSFVAAVVGLFVGYLFVNLDYVKFDSDDQKSNTRVIAAIGGFFIGILITQTLFTTVTTIVEKYKEHVKTRRPNPTVKGGSGTF